MSALAFSPRSARDAVEAGLAVCAAHGGNLRAEVRDLPGDAADAYFAYEADLSRVFYLRHDEPVRELHGVARLDGWQALVPPRR